MVRVSNDILTAMDKKQGTMLVLLDLSAAFDTIDHVLMLDRLSHIGVRGTAHKWFSSYLENRYQSVNIQGISSKKQRLRFGVPQGSVLGPFLFTQYTVPIGAICRRHGVNYQLYADDTQVYVSFSITNEQDREIALAKIKACIAEIRAWMLAHRLKLNDDKTESVVFAPSRITKVNIDGVRIGDCDIEPNPCARNIGVYFDSSMNMNQQITKLCKICNFWLFCIRRIRRCLTVTATQQLVQALVLSRLDYCNSLLAGLPSSQVARLQRIQNAGARVIACVPRYDHTSPVLMQLHWLPVSQRIEYKVLLLAFTAIQGKAPRYICDMIQERLPQRATRSSTSVMLTQPYSYTKTFGDRAFSVVAPRLWNELPTAMREPLSLDNFKRKLKTYLFRKAFSRFL